MPKSIFIAALLFFVTTISASTLKADEEVIFYDSYGYYRNGKLHLNIHGCVYEKQEKSALRNLFISALKKFISAKDSNDLFASRIKPFLQDNERNKIVNIALNGENYSLNFTGPDGHTVTEIVQDSARYPVLQPAELIFFSRPGPNNSNTYSGRVRIMPAATPIVISDIDDTIKESNVEDKKILLQNTFEKEYRPVRGMPEFYHKLAAKGTVFHYLSASPWQLYQPLHSFIAGFYPQGVLHLKKFRLKDYSIIDFLLQNQFDYKMSVISELTARFPRRQFILIGDTGEEDAELFADAARRYPQQITAVYLRQTGKKKSAEEIRRLYENIRTVKFKLFTEPSEL